MRGDADGALASIGGSLGAVPLSDPLARAGLLPARVTIVLAVGDVEDAGIAAAEMDAASSY